MTFRPTPTDPVDPEAQRYLDEFQAYQEQLAQRGHLYRQALGALYVDRVMRDLHDLHDVYDLDGIDKPPDPHQERQRILRRVGTAGTGRAGGSPVGWEPVTEVEEAGGAGGAGAAREVIEGSFTVLSDDVTPANGVNRPTIRIYRHNNESNKNNEKKEDQP